ncbi:hypothetical protein PV433_32935 [Paenibacillus sp. GYB004]|uniref:hypothetical protein n=1 Tax=Paenibacillus sp. GYB004 TaxID=2994393 RepID=UPI002F9657FB
MELLIRIFFGIIEFYGLCILTFAMFRLPVAENGLRLLIVAVALEAVSVYQLHYLGMAQSTAFLFVIAAYILLVKFIFNIRLIFSVMVCLVGYLGIGIIQTALVVAAPLLLNISTEQMGTSLVIAMSFQFVTFIVNISIAYLLTTRRIGFMFFEKRISRNLETRAQDIYLLIVLISCLGVLQLLFISFSESQSLVHLYVIYIALIIIALYITYQKNKKELLDHYNRLKERNRSI